MAAISPGSYCYVQNWNGGWASYGNFRFSQFNIAPFAGNSLNVRQTTDGVVRANFVVFPGEDKQFKSQGPNISVQDSGCCWICACGTHPDTGEPGGRCSCHRSRAPTSGSGRAASPAVIDGLRADCGRRLLDHRAPGA